MKFKPRVALRGGDGVRAKMDVGQRPISSQLALILSGDEQARIRRVMV